jgi:muconate cycloisomerase
LLLATPFDDVPVLLGSVDRAVRGHHYARTALEQALLDLTARRRGVPVYELLGGRLRDAIPVAHSIGLMDDDAAVAEIGQVLEEGVRTIKLKTGEDPDRDVRFVRAVRRTFGDAIRIGVDANGGWGSAAEALRVIRKIEDCDLAYVEQPVRGMVELERLLPKVDTPLMADESTWTARDVMEVARRNAADLVSIYTSKAGGLLNARQMDAVAQAAGLGTNVNGSGESGVGNLANLHLAAACYSSAESSVIPITGLHGNRPTQVAQAVYTDDVLVAPFELVNGCVTVPSGPGWGIDVDTEKVATYSVEKRRFHA